VLRKSTASVFPSTGIDQRLKAACVRTLLITGLTTHACVAGAARDAVPMGYQVIVAADACATRDLDTGAGEQSALPLAVQHRAALASIDDIFGDVMTTKQVLELALV
jgi:nicotinamidase-related amidase